MKKILAATILVGVINFLPVNFEAGNFQAVSVAHSAELNDNESLAQQKFEEGLELNERENYQSAIEKYTEAIQLNRKFTDAYNNRGACYLYLKNYNEAIQDFDKAILLAPDNVNAYNNRGYAYLMLQNYAQAIKDCETAIKLNPKFEKPYMTLGLVYGTKKILTKQFAVLIKLLK